MPTWAKMHSPGNADPQLGLAFFGIWPSWGSAFPGPREIMRRTLFFLLFPLPTQRGFVTKSRVPPMINSEGLRKLHPSSSTSIPHIPFVILHLMSIQQITILFLEGFGAIVFLLIGNVLFHLWNI